MHITFGLFDLRHHSLLHREVFGFSRELGVFDATSFGRVAKLGSDVQNCFAATYGRILFGAAYAVFVIECKYLELGF